MVGKSTATVVQGILSERSHFQQNLRRCQGILNFSRQYGNERLEKACQRAIFINSANRKSIHSILEKGLDQVELESSTSKNQVIVHENIRGNDYYQ